MSVRAPVQAFTSLLVAIDVAVAVALLTVVIAVDVALAPVVTSLASFQTLARDSAAVTCCTIGTHHCTVCAVPTGLALLAFSIQSVAFHTVIVRTGFITLQAKEAADASMLAFPKRVARSLLAEAAAGLVAICREMIPAWFAFSAEVVVTGSTVTRTWSVALLSLPSVSTPSCASSIIPVTSSVPAVHVALFRAPVTMETIRAA